MAEKAPCHVWKGNNRLHGLHMREIALLIVMYLPLVIETNFDLMLSQKHPTYPFSPSSPPENAHFSLVKRRRNLSLCSCSVFLLFSRYPQRVTENPYSSKLAPFPRFCLRNFVSLFSSPLFGDLSWVTWDLRVPSAQSPFSHWLCVWSWNWVTAIFDSCVTQRTEILPPWRAEEKSLTSAWLVPSDMDTVLLSFSCCRASKQSQNTLYIVNDDPQRKRRYFRRAVRMTTTTDWRPALRSSWEHLTK